MFPIFNRIKQLLLIIFLVSILFIPPIVSAAEDVIVPVIDDTTEVMSDNHNEASMTDSEAGGHGAAAKTFLWIAVILVIAKVSGLIERFGQPAVLGELVVGVILGNLILIGINVFEPIKHDTIIQFLAELGVVVLLFQIGLESNIKEMGKVGMKAFSVAIVGVVVPFILGAYIVGPWLFPGLSSNAYMFLAAALTATSVGITARVFKDLGKLKSPEAQIVLGAAVIDDVLGLIILAVISALVTVGAVSLGMVSWIVAKAVLFLVGSIVLGHTLAPKIGELFSKIHSGNGMKFTLAISFGLLLAFFAGAIGLAPIVGAFAAGLVLDRVHFKHFKKPEICEEVTEAINGNGGQLNEKLTTVIRTHSDKHVEDLIEPLSYFLVPIFFVVTGMAVNLTTLSNGKVVMVALAISVVAIAGKLVSGLVAGPVNKWIVGWGMVPRGEVGLIFASIGKALGVVTDEVFSIIVIMVIITTLLTPPMLNMLLKKQNRAAQPV